MKFAPWWKIRRELIRIGRSPYTLSKRYIRPIFANRYYDLYLSKFRKRWDGVLPLGHRIAILVIYQPYGLFKSTLLSLDHINLSGYSPVVVSNWPLSQDERLAILARCALLIERPNFGYDFGGYRDGIHSIEDFLPELKRLVLLNDSVWYPLPETSNWLLDAEASGPDLVGAVSVFGTPRFKDKLSFNNNWTYSFTNRRFHYGSFALSFGPNSFRHVAFQRFWNKLPLHNDRMLVVKSGEIGLTRLIKKLGLSHDCICGPRYLDKILDRMSFEELYDLILNLQVFEQKEFLETKRKLVQTKNSRPNWRSDACFFALQATSRFDMGNALPSLTIRKLAFPFLKKSPFFHGPDSAEVSFRIIQDLPGAMGNAIREEAELIYNSRMEIIRNRD